MGEGFNTSTDFNLHQLIDLNLRTIAYIGTWGRDPTKDFLIYRLEGFKITNALFSKAKEWPGWGREGGLGRKGGD